MVDPDGFVLWRFVVVIIVGLAASELVARSLGRLAAWRRRRRGVKYNSQS